MLCRSQVITSSLAPTSPRRWPTLSRRWIPRMRPADRAALARIHRTSAPNTSSLLRRLVATSRLTPFLMKFSSSTAKTSAVSLLTRRSGVLQRACARRLCFLGRSAQVQGPAQAPSTPQEPMSINSFTQAAVNATAIQVNQEPPGPLRSHHRRSKRRIQSARSLQILMKAPLRERESGILTRLDLITSEMASEGSWPN